MTGDEKIGGENEQRVVEDFFAGRGLRTKESLEARLARLIEMDEAALARHVDDPELRDRIEANLDRLEALQQRLQSLPAQHDAVVAFLKEAEDAGV